ncbi:MAG: phosphomethylpyrimidine synthase ThiC [candidate division KSB1 bacterium]|nr:phosphomethylpyrimidine synthase ThiC [candidate division KSB1 bacterium]
MTQICEARKGNITPEVRAVAAQERIEPELLASRVAAGEVVILKNRLHSIEKVCGVGNGLRTKVNANIGTSSDIADIGLEVEKAKVAVAAGADTIMDLSSAGDLDRIRQAVMDAAPVPIGTVPIYQAAIECAARKGGIVHMTVDDLFAVLQRQAEQGVDFFTVHCGVTLSALERLRKEGRVTDVVSRGGSFHITWMVANERENPLYEQFDRLLEIAKRYDITLSLGDGFRPGSLADATDRAQVQELITLGELAKTAWDEGVQVMIEGPGHLPLREVEANVLLEKKLCHGAPFYVLGPLVTDVAPGYDHIVSAIGGAIAAAAGADFLCYVTAGEHLRLPTVQDVRDGVIVTRIAAHVADLAKGIPGAEEWDLAMARARKALDWERQIALAIDPVTARRAREEAPPEQNDVCTMCGEYCALKLVTETLGHKD